MLLGQEFWKLAIFNFWLETPQIESLFKCVVLGSYCPISLFCCTTHSDRKFQILSINYETIFPLKWATNWLSELNLFIHILVSTNRNHKPSASKPYFPYSKSRQRVNNIWTKFSIPATVHSHTMLSADMDVGRSRILKSKVIETRSVQQIFVWLGLCAYVR